VDTVIVSIGQQPDLSPLAGVEATRWGTLAADPNKVTPLTGVFACGDAVTGPASVIEAIAAGKEAAESIDRYLQGQDWHEGRLFEWPRAADIQVKTAGREQVPRQAMPKIPLTERKTGFKEVQLGFTGEQALAEATRCLSCAICSECLQCVQVCEHRCIDHEMREEILDVEVGAIVLATGFDPYDPSPLKEYGYGQIANVITGLEYERLISASGPTGGELRRPSDGRVPDKLAFIQCVGSRDVHYNPYCSSVCCMHATKEAILAGEHYPGLRSYIFYTDVRATGKRFQEYITRARQEYGVAYIRGRPGKITQNPETGNPVIWYDETILTEAKDPVRRATSLEVGMVVLCQALVPHRSHQEIAEKLGVALDEAGFVDIPDKLSRPVDTNVPGVFACGFCQAPQDIPDSVIQASGVAARVAEFLSS